MGKTSKPPAIYIYILYIYIYIYIYIIAYIRPQHLHVLSCSINLQTSLLLEIRLKQGCLTRLLLEIRCIYILLHINSPAGGFRMV